MMTMSRRLRGSRRGVDHLEDIELENVPVHITLLVCKIEDMN